MSVAPMCNGVGGSVGFLAGSGRFGRGPVINRLCESLAMPSERERFHADENTYCLRFGLSREERQAIKDRDYLLLLGMGASITKLAHLAGVAGCAAPGAPPYWCGPERR